MQQYGKKKSFCIFKTQSSNTSEVAHSPVTTALTPHFINTRSQWSWNINTIFKCVIKIRKVPTEVVREVPFFWTITSYWLPKLHLLEMNPRRTGGCCLWSLCYERWVSGKLKCFTGVQITWTFRVREFSSGLWVLCSVCAGRWAQNRQQKEKCSFLALKHVCGVHTE